MPLPGFPLAPAAPPSALPASAPAALRTAALEAPPRWPRPAGTAQAAALGRRRRGHSDRRAGDTDATSDLQFLSESDLLKETRHLHESALKSL